MLTGEINAISLSKMNGRILNRILKKKKLNLQADDYYVSISQEDTL
jgi:hypothetical protein